MVSLWLSVDALSRGVFLSQGRFYYRFLTIVFCTLQVLLTVHLVRNCFPPYDLPVLVAHRANRVVIVCHRYYGKHSAIQVSQMHSVGSSIHICSLLVTMNPNLVQLAGHCQ
jgi:hypothetical protein